jgi:hypothetical protein
MAIKLLHGVRGGRIVRITEVENGLSCGCVCPTPQCGAQLIAVQGSKVAWHFRHYLENHHEQTEYECAEAIETAIHLLAKDILASNKEQILPARTATLRRHNFDEIKQEHKKLRTRVVQEQRLVFFDDMRSENDYSTYINTDDSFIKPDVIAVKGSMEMYFEIRVTHAVDKVKREKIKELGKSCIEIDLSHVDRNISIDALKKEVLDPTNRKWICHRKDDKFLRQATAIEEQAGKFYRQKRAEEEKKKLELAKNKREQEEKDRNIANYREFKTDFFKEIWSTDYPWKGGFVDERIRRFISSNEFYDETSTILNKYDSNASINWSSEDEDGIEWEIMFCGKAYYSRSRYFDGCLNCIQEGLFNFLKDLLPQDVIEEVNLRETKNREEKERRRIEQEEYLKKLEKEKKLREQEEAERQKAELERQYRERERMAAMAKELEKREQQKHAENKEKFMTCYLEIRSRKSIQSPWNKDVTPSEIKAKCGFDDMLFVRLRKELQAEKNLNQLRKAFYSQRSSNRSLDIANALQINISIFLGSS